jgi:oligoendopeptidase F
VLLANAAAEPTGARRWDLRDLYPDVPAWQRSFDATQAQILALELWRGTLAKSAADMLQALAAVSDARREVERLEVYAHLQSDEDLRVAPAQERKQRAQQLSVLLREKTAWLAPAIQALGDKQVRAFIAAEPQLKARFDFYLDDTLRNTAHTLPPEGEALLAAAGTLLDQPHNVFQQLAESELPLTSLRMADGQNVEMGTAAYEKYRVVADREQRKRVFDAFFGALKRVEGTLGANLATQVMGDAFMARSRKFGTSLEAALFEDSMPPAVYATLVAQAHAGLPTLQRYLRLRQKVVGIPGKLAYYDNYPPLVPEPPGQVWTVARSQAETLQALAPLGDEYLGLLRQGFAAQWVDSHPRPSKAAGGYMAGGAYDVHPYLLLNHNDDFESLSTVAHEWGHAVHSLLSNKAQPYDKSGYSTFIAESASIANEMLLSDHLVATAKTRGDKLFYLSQALESIRTTFFRQVMFAEFQLAMHEEVEQGRALSGARLSELYCGIAQRYYGQAEGVMEIDPAYCNEWEYVSHFYRGFYVWQYATSMVGAARFSSDIRREGAPARARFIDLLKAGNSDYAYRLYVKAGVDLAQPAPYQALMARMNRLLDEFERIAATPG